MNGSGKISSSPLDGTGNELHCCNGDRRPSEICQPTVQNCLRREDSKEINMNNEMFPNQIKISNEVFPKNLIVKADQQ